MDFVNRHDLIILVVYCLFVEESRISEVVSTPSISLRTLLLLLQDAFMQTCEVEPEECRGVEEQVNRLPGPCRVSAPDYTVIEGWYVLCYSLSTTFV